LDDHTHENLNWWGENWKRGERGKGRGSS